MKNRNYFKKFAFAALLLAFASGWSAAQGSKVPSPREENLLNGLKLLVWTEPQPSKAVVVIRFHRGSAFDHAGKTGTIALLADMLFPDQSIKEFFAQELGGDLEVTSNYDYIQLKAAADNDKLLTVLETLSNAVINPQIDKETTAAAVTARLERVKREEGLAGYIADLEAANRLLGDYPYGRPMIGRSESLPRIDFADILFAKQRFLTPDNATIAVSSSENPDFVYRAVRRFFGLWEKSEQVVPATFTQPSAPAQSIFTVESAPAAGRVRYAIRGLARNDKDFFASQIAARVFETRLREKTAADGDGDVTLTYDEHLLPSILILGYTTRDDAGKDAAPRPVNILDLISKPVTPAEFQSARNDVAARFAAKDKIDVWLDVDTYRLASVRDDLQKLSGVTPADVNRAAGRLQKNPSVTVVFMRPKSESAAETTKN